MFENIIGNDNMKKELTNYIETNKISHSYLFLGISGIGKKIFAHEFAKMILKNEKMDLNNNPDFTEIFPDGNNIKIEQIREIQKRIIEQPVVSNNKVYIIDDADKMTIEAQNCMLKTLEEPPKFATIILIGSNESKFLSTIKSRCIILKFNPIKLDEIEEFLKNKYDLQSISKNLIEATGGSIGKAEVIMEKKDLYMSLEQIISNIENSSLIDTLKSADIVYKSQNDKYDILEFFNLLLYKKAKENIKYINCINIVEEAKKRLNANSNYNMTIDNMIMSIWEEIN